MGEAVLVDKPFARSADEADKVIKIAEQTGLILTCFQNRRWVSELVVLLMPKTCRLI
jgi:predicted dehydrogenase